MCPTAPTAGTPELQPLVSSVTQLQANGCSAGNRVERTLPVAALHVDQCQRPAVEQPQGGVRTRRRLSRGQHAGAAASAALLQRAIARMTPMQVLEQLCGEQQTVGVSMYKVGAVMQALQHDFAPLLPVLQRALPLPAPPPP